MLAILSTTLLIMTIASVHTYRKDVTHPGFWTNISFFVYTLSGLYFSYYGSENAYFFEKAGISYADADDLLILSMSYVCFAYAFCNFGFYAARKFILSPIPKGYKPTPVKVAPWLTRGLLLYTGVTLITIGFTSWIYISSKLAGGVLALFENVAAFKILAEDSQVSTLPYHLAYAGIMLWLIGWLSASNRQALGLLFVPIGMLMILSTARITQAGVFGLSALISFFVIRYGRVNLKSLFVWLVPMMIVLISYFFYRQATSYRYSGIEGGIESIARENNQDAFEAASDYVGYILYDIFGKGNALDLQQIGLIINGLDQGKLIHQLGATYFDWAYTLFDTDNGNSVGIRIKEAFFPDIAGAPVPGMIGEAILNFGYLFPIFLLFACFISYMLYVYYADSNSVFIKTLYCKFIIGFWAVFMKVDSSNILVFLWSVVPFSIMYLIVVFFSPVQRATRRKIYATS